MARKKERSFEEIDFLEDNEGNLHVAMPWKVICQMVGAWGSEEVLSMILTDLDFSVEDGDNIYKFNVEKGYFEKVKK